MYSPVRNDLGFSEVGTFRGRVLNLVLRRNAQTSALDTILGQVPLKGQIRESIVLGQATVFPPSFLPLIFQEFLPLSLLFQKKQHLNLTGILGLEGAIFETILRKKKILLDSVRKIHFPIKAY